MAFTRSMSSSVKQLLRSAKVGNDHVKNLLFVEFDSHVATVEYENYGDVYDLVHTKIPDELQGQGLGTLFAEKIFDHLVSKEKKIRLTCEFLDNFYRKNLTKYKDSVVED